MLTGQITEIITSRAFVSFGGYMTFESSDTKYLKKYLCIFLKNIGSIVIMWY